MNYDYVIVGGGIRRLDEAARSSQPRRSAC